MATERSPEYKSSIQENIRVERCEGLMSIILGADRVHIAYLKNEESPPLGVSSKRHFEELLEKAQVVNLADGILLFSDNVQTATLENPIKMSANSDAKYLAKLQTDDFLFLYQYLDGQTSRHMHPGEGELFIPQEGSNPSYVYNSTVEIITDKLWLPPDTYHEAFSLQRPTMTAIVQSARVMHDHDPEGRTPIVTLRQKLQDHLAQRR